MSYLSFNIRAIHEQDNGLPEKISAAEVALLTRAIHDLILGVKYGHLDEILPAHAFAIKFWGGHFHEPLIVRHSIAVSLMNAILADMQKEYSEQKEREAAVIWPKSKPHRGSNITKPKKKRRK